MKKTYAYKEKRNLQVGKIYNFFIVKLMQLPDGIKYFILEDPFGEKHLLPFKYYVSYKITGGEYYQCRVDKINCQGRMFIEPLHPQYLLGNKYEFRYLKTENYVRKKGSLKMFLMKGHNGFEAWLPFNENINVSEISNWRKYKVVKIKKANVFLSF